MLLILCGLLLLVAGYFVYGRLVERIVGPDDRETPAVSNADGVDFMVLPHWKNMLIQLLNIAGVGPVIGVILGIKFGSIVFIIISGVCDGLFSIGSPLMVLYFLSKTEDKEEYLGTLQMLFFMTLLFNTVVRFSHHILQPEHVPVVLAGAAGIAVGLTVANKIVNRVDDRVFRRFAYMAIALSGIYNLLF